ncbi:hypothetical protein [Streptomyces longispororuber]|uniref:hypothetical protein n=1 Tax=Streptomyces longispororuber TaxID=68230 RepID=UPI00167CFC28|nr:hypothetical protein [Streptomyces longispororuber]
MTTPSRDRALGRGVSALIPPAGAGSATDRATAALAALRTVPVHVGVLQAAVVLLEEEQPGADPARAAAIESTVALLRTAIGQAADDLGPSPGRAG